MTRTCHFGLEPLPLKIDLPIIFASKRVGRIFAMIQTKKNNSFPKGVRKMFFQSLKNFLNRKRSRKNGFTLIELLIVILTLFVLAAIALPSLGSMRMKGYNTTSYSDLKNMCTAQEGYFVDYQTYTSVVDDLALYGFRKSPGVTPLVTRADSVY